MKNKLLAVLLAMSMSLTMLPGVAMAAEGDETGPSTETTTPADPAPDGTQTPGDGEQEPDDGEQTPGDGEQKPDDGEQTPGDGEQKPGDGEQTPGDGEQKPDDGEQTPEPAVYHVKTAGELRAQMEAAMGEHDEIWLDADITLQKADISTTGAELHLNGHKLTMNDVNINITVSGNGNGRNQFSIVGTNSGRVDSISNCRFTTEKPEGDALVLYGAQVQEIRDSNFGGSLEAHNYKGNSRVDTIEGCEVELFIGAYNGSSIGTVNNCKIGTIVALDSSSIGRITRNTISEGVFIGDGDKENDKSTVERISWNTFTSSDPSIALNSASRLNHLGENTYTRNNTVSVAENASIAGFHATNVKLDNDGYVASYTVDPEEDDNYITITESDHGTVTPSTRRAEAGERVSLYVKADKGYKLDTITVKDVRGRTITCRSLGDDSYYFIMPSVKVTIEAKFVKTEDDASTTTTPSTTPADDEPFTGLGTPGVSGIVLNPAAMPFTDVKGPDWFYNSVEYVWKHYLMSGVSDTQFAPDTTTSRAMIWTILARMNNVRTDINPGSSWYEKGLLWCKEKGLTDGTDPMSDITREQLATMLWRNAGQPGGANGDLNAFSDSASVSGYAQTAMRWAVANGILNGDSGKLDPQGTATRAQVAAMVARYGDKIASK